jgi:DNA repair exonuclease SbcCD ATPase subunit
LLSNVRESLSNVRELLNNVHELLSNVHELLSNVHELLSNVRELQRNIRKVHSDVPRVDNLYLTIQKIIDVASDDRSSMSPTDSGDLCIKLGDGITLSSSIGREAGKVFGRFRVKNKKLIEELFVKYDVRGILKPLFPVSFWQNSNAIQDFSLGNCGRK